MNRLFIALALLAAAGGAAYWTYQKEQAKEGKPAADAAPTILEVPDAQITQIEFRRKGETAPTILKRTGNVTWQIASPKQLRGDTDAIQPLLTMLGHLTSDALVSDNNQDWKTYGLDDPTLQVLITKKDGKVVNLQLGDEQPAGGSIYVRVAGEPKLYTLATFNRATLDRTWKDLRDKRLLTLEADKLSKLEFTAKGSSIEFGKNGNNEWQIVKPEAFRAENGVVEEAARKMMDLKLDPQVAEAEQAKADAGFASASPGGVARFTTPAGTQQLEIRKAGADTFYAKSSVVEGAYKVAADVAALLEKGLDGYRNRKVFEFGFSEPSKIEIKQAGTVKSYGKNGEQWYLNGKQMKPETVQALIDKMREITAVKFTASSKETPALEITVVSGEGAKKTETVKFAGSLAGRAEDPAFRYDVGPNTLPELQKAIDGIVPAPAPQQDGKKK